MTLLKAMSEIDPKDIEAAEEAGTGGIRAPVNKAPPAEPAAPGTAQQVLPAITTVKPGQPAAAPPVGRHSFLSWRTAGISAAAACFALTAGVMLWFRGQNDGFVAAPSQPEQITELTAADTTAALTQQTTITTASGKAQTTVHGSTAPVQTTVTKGEETDITDARTEETAKTEETLTDQTTTETSRTTTTEPVTYAAKVPALLVTGDAAGTLPERAELQIISDAAAIQAYLSGDDPVTEVGSGHKSAAEQTAIERAPLLLRIRWKTDGLRVESYGLQGVSLDADGVLHVQAAGYCPDPETAGNEPWVYETSLLIQAGTLPAVKQLDLKLETFTESEGGVMQWLAYEDSLSDDIYIMNDNT